MKHKIMIFTIIVGMIVFLFASCSSIKVTGDYDKTVNFSQYESYEFFGWAEESDQLMNDFDKRRIQSAFANEFANELSKLDEIILLDIYPAREKPIDGITSKTILDKMDNRNCRIMTKHDTLDYISKNKPEVLLTLGAGDIGLLVPKIETELN